MATRLAWIVAIALGLLGGGFAFHFPGSYGDSGGVGAAVFGFVLGAVNGLFVGVLAWIALRLPRRDGGRLLVAISLIVGGTHALNDGSSTQLPFVVVQVVAGLVAAGTAAWILREHRPSTLAIIGVAWTLGLLAGGWSGNAIGLPLTETPLGWALDHAWDGLVSGLIWGTATAAIGLPEALRRSHRRSSLVGHPVRAVTYSTLPNSAWDRRSGLHQLDFGFDLTFENEIWRVTWAVRGQTLEIAPGSLRGELRGDPELIDVSALEPWQEVVGFPLLKADARADGSCSLVLRSARGRDI